jgi:hypothetical protein
MSNVFKLIRGQLSPKDLDTLKTSPRRPPKPKSAGQVIAKSAAIDKKVRARQIDELIGICRGVLADGALVSPEVHFLGEWLQVNLECSDVWPYDRLYNRVMAALADGVITTDEEGELLTLLHQVSGGIGAIQDSGPPVGPSTEGLPYDNPEPSIVFPDRGFCVTGEFAYGPRKEVCEEIEQRGGRILGAPSKKVHFLVVGISGSHAWKHSTHGTKIMRAIELRDAGGGIAIVSEKHWTAHL